jgi:hypothetical protein
MFEVITQTSSIINIYLPEKRNATKESFEVEEKPFTSS